MRCGVVKEFGLSRTPQTQPISRAKMGCLGVPGCIRHIRQTRGTYAESLVSTRRLLRFGANAFMVPVWCAARGAKSGYIYRMMGNPSLVPFSFSSSYSSSSPLLSPSCTSNSSSSSFAMVRQKITYYKMLTPEDRAEIKAEIRATKEGRHTIELATMGGGEVAGSRCAGGGGASRRGRG